VKRWVLFHSKLLSSYWYLAVDISLVRFLNHQIDKRLHIGLGKEGVPKFRCIPEHNTVFDYSCCVFLGEFCIFGNIGVLGVLGILHKSTCFGAIASFILGHTRLHRNPPFILPISLVLEPKVTSLSTTLKHPRAIFPLKVTSYCSSNPSEYSFSPTLTLEDCTVVSPPDQFEAWTLRKLNLISHRGVDQEGHVQPH